MGQPNARDASRGSPVFWLVLAVGVLFSALGAIWARQIQVGKTAARQDAEAAKVHRDLVESRENYQEFMLGLRGMIRAKGDLDLATFHAYVADLDLFTRHKGLLAVSFGYFVDGPSLGAFRQRMAKEWAAYGMPFTIHPAGDREGYFIVAYGDPLATSPKVIGADTLALPGNQQSLEQALKEGRVVASAPLKVVQYEGPDPGLILRLAVTRKGARSAPLDRRHPDALGCINCVFRSSQMIEDALGAPTLDRSDLWIVDRGPVQGGPAAEPRTVFGREPVHRSAFERLLRPCPPSTQLLDFCGRQWEVQLALRKAPLGDQEWLQPLGVAVIGLLATFLLAGFLKAQARVGRQARLLAERMTDQYRRVQQELEWSQANLAAVIQSTTDLVWSVDREYRLLTFNATFHKHMMDHYGRAPVVGQTLDAFLPRERADLWPERYARALQEGSFQTDYVLEDGEVLDLDLHPILQGDAVVGVSIFGKNVTAKKRAEESLRLSEERYRNIVDRAPTGIYRRDLEGRIVYASPGLLKQFDCPDLATFQQNYAEVAQRWASREQYDLFMEILLRDGQIEGFENEVRLRSGALRWHLLYTYRDQRDPGYFDGFSVDVTPLKAAEVERTKIKEQLHQSQKMEALGQLAGGVAHDFNNMLMGIIGAAELLSLEDGELPREKRQKYVNLILTAATRAGDLISKLLASSRKGKQTFNLLETGAIVKDVVAILERTLDKRIAITLEDHAATTLVLGDEARLSSLFMNLGINAGQAMPDGGALAFVVRTVALDAAFCAGSPFEILPGSYVEIEVRDTGQGMTEATRNRIFEPFFTTKEPGKGTGLGLSMVYGTIQDHRGAVHVYSEPGTGTTFHVYLPLSAAPAGPGGDARVVPGTGTILVVDDEEILRTTSQTMLNQLGYTVLTAADGREALDCFQRSHHDLDLVLLDMVMPIMSGRQAFEGMRAIDDRIPVLLASGFSKDEDLAAMSLQGLCGFIRKPYRIAELSQAIARILDERKTRG